MPIPAIPYRVETASLAGEIYLDKDPDAHIYTAYRYNINCDLLEPYIATVDLMVDYTAVVFSKYGPLDFNVPPSYEYFVQLCDNLDAARDYIARYSYLSYCDIEINSKTYSRNLYDVTELNDNELTLIFEPYCGELKQGDVNARLTLHNISNLEIAYMVKGDIINTVHTNRGYEVKILTDGWHYILENNIVIKAEALDPALRM